MKKKDDSFMRASEVGALVEGLRSDFHVFGEGLVALRDKVDGLDKKVDSLDKKVESLAEGQRVIEIKMDVMYKELRCQRADITEIKTILPNHEKRIARLEEISAK